MPATVISTAASQLREQVLCSEMLSERKVSARLWAFACVSSVRRLSHPPDAWRLSLVFVSVLCVGVSSSSVRRARLAWARRHVVPLAV